MSEFVDKVKESVESLQNVVKILSLGVDYRKYVKFRLFTPYVLKMLNGSYVIQRVQRGSNGIPTKNDVQFCIDFVVESAITLQKFDFSIEEE